MRLAAFFVLVMSVLLSACQTMDAKNCSPASKDEAARLVYNAASIEDATHRFGVEPSFIQMRSGKRTKVKVGKIAGLADDLTLA